MTTSFAAIALVAMAAAAPAAGGTAPVGVVSARTGVAPDPALTALGACFTQQRAGQMVILLDQSASLQTSDPQNDRVTSAQYLVSNLSEFASRAKVDLKVRVAGFDTTYHPAGSWQQLPGAVADVRSTVAKVGAVNNGFETDYWTALEGARQDLGSVAKSVDGQLPCQAIVWFTDGKFELDWRRDAEQEAAYGVTKPYAPDVSLTTPSSVPVVEKKGRDALCRPGQLADALRTAGITTLAIGLSPSAGDKGNFDFMQSIATGRGGGTTCGAITTPAPGDFHLASNVDDIIFAFDAISDPGQQPVIDTTGKVCTSGAPCTKTVQFVLDQSIGKAHVLVGANVDGVQVVVDGPSGKAQYSSGSSPSGPAQSVGTGTWVSKRTLSLDLTRPRGGRGWAGVWSVTVVGPAGTSRDAVSRAQVRITGDLLPSWPAAASSKLRSGDAAVSLTFGLVTEDGEAVPPQALQGTALFNAALVDAGGKSHSIVQAAGKSGIVGPHKLDLSGISPGPATVQLTLGVTTAPYGSQPGTTLSPRAVEYAVTVLPPLNFPTVSSSTTFPQMDSLGPVTSSVDVSGPGCVWLDSTNVSAAPEGAGQVRVSSPTANSEATCLRVGAGQTVALPLELRVDATENGALAGTLSVALAAANDPSQHVLAPVRFSGELIRPPDRPKEVIAFVIALLLGLGLPPLFLWLTKWWTARIPSGGGLWVSTFDAMVSPTSITAVEGGAINALSGDRSFVGIDLDGVRELGLPFGGLRLKTRTGPNPVGSATVVVESAWATVSGVAPHQNAAGQAVLPLAVHNHWIAWLADTGELRVDQPRRVTVVILASGLARDETYAQISNDIRETLPTLLDRLVPANVAAVTVPESATDEWSSSQQQEEWSHSDDWAGRDDWGAQPAPGGSSGSVSPPSERTSTDTGAEPSGWKSGQDSQSDDW